MDNERFKISKIVIFVLVIMLGFVLIKTTFSNNVVNTNNEKKEVELMSGLHHVVISVKDLGDIKLELDANIAPITVTNFLKLVVYNRKCG